MSPPTLKIFFHDNCFDGVTSAALFADFYRSKRNSKAQILFQGVAHGNGDPFAGLAIDGDENACVDFRYCADPHMGWWIDHHISAFQPPSLRAHFDADKSGTKFFDPEARSCSVFAASVLEEHFDYRPDPSAHWQELLTWADKIDGAVFESAREIVELKESALQLMTWIGSNRDTSLTTKLIGRVGHQSLAELIEEPWIAEPLQPLLKVHRDSVAMIGERITVQDGVASYVVGVDELPNHNKFIAYMLFPEITYTVSLTRIGSGGNISVGSNPWASQPRTHNIAKICERYGGGGHPAVGGIAVAVGADPLAIMTEICAELGTNL